MIVACFYGLNRLNIKQEDSGYFNMILDKCNTLIKLHSVSSVLQFSFNGLYVDEYQDCSIMQHIFIMSLSTLFPTHLLGDPLQGIYDFDGDRVDMNRNLIGWTFFDVLTTPWRWHIQNYSTKLGEKILFYRNALLSSNNNIVLENDATSHFYVKKLSSNDSNYYLKVGKFLRALNGESILIIVPTYIDADTGIFHGKITDRAKLRNRLCINHSYQLIEAIDDKSFYSVSKAIDETIEDICRAHKKYKKLSDLLVQLQFNKTDVTKWFDKNTNRVISKRAPNNLLSQQLQQICDGIISSPSYSGIQTLFTFCKKSLKFEEKRPELYGSIAKCLSLSNENKKSAYSNMCDLKNSIRIKGRKVEGKYIGTTLLTKGLEFETVVILDAHNFADKRNFYVAISRACKDLYLFSEKLELSLKD